MPSSAMRKRAQEKLQKKTSLSQMNISTLTAVSGNVFISELSRLWDNAGAQEQVQFLKKMTECKKQDGHKRLQNFLSNTQRFDILKGRLPDQQGDLDDYLQLIADKAEERMQEMIKNRLTKACREEAAATGTPHPKEEEEEGVDLQLPVQSWIPVGDRVMGEIYVSSIKQEPERNEDAWRQYITDVSNHRPRVKRF